MHVDTVYALRQALGLDAPGTPVKVIEPYQMLGEIKMDLIERLGVDVVSLALPGTMFGFKNQGWKPWTTFGGSPVLVPEDFNTVPEADGSLMMYAGGDLIVSAQCQNAERWLLFRLLSRHTPVEDEDLNVEDNLE